MEISLRLLDCDFKNPNYRPILSDDSKELLASLKRIAVTETRTRKFIALKNDKKIYVVVGPELVDNENHPSFYKHRDLRQAALTILDKDGKGKYQITGGGSITFEYKDYMKGWFAEWGGQSMDYGVYDPSILAHTHYIANWLELPINFNWRDRGTPSKKK